MKVTKYYCDKCNKEVPKINSLVELNIEVRNYADVNTVKNAYQSIGLCLDCCEKVGIIPKPEQEQTEQILPLSERLCDIMAEIVQEKLNA